MRRGLRGFRLRRRDPFRYVPLRRAGRARFIAAFREVMSGTLSGDLNPRTPAQEFRLLQSLAGPALDPDLWRLAYVGRRLAGMLLAQRRPAKPEEGTFYFFGVAPAFRGRGYGTLLHAAGLGLLARSGCRSYQGGTDVRNKPMLAAFRANGCRTIGTWICDARTGRKLRRA